MNSGSSGGDSSYVSNVPSVNESSHVPQSASQEIRPYPQSLVFQFHDSFCKSSESSSSTGESLRRSPEEATCTIAFPGHYTRGFQDGGIEFCIPGVTHGIFTPDDGVNVHFELEKEGDTEQSSLNCFVAAAATLIDWHLQNQARVQGFDQTELNWETQEQRMSGFLAQRQKQLEVNDIRPYANYFCSRDCENWQIEKRNTF
ncbi:hypothetical protein Aperf_G00000041929 [Anoplocephala perfoliata]